VGNAIKKYVMEFPGAKVRVNPIGIFGSANESPVQVIVTGADRELVSKAAYQVLDTLKAMQGTTALL
jgi:HAE1 family hydrophobic/amphiphilic exporter-1